MDREYTQRLPCWYLIRTRPRQDDRAVDNLKAWDIEIFAPRVMEHRYHTFTDEPMQVKKPLFAGYIFARFVLEGLYHKVCFTRGVHSIVSFGANPTPVEDEIISIIKSRMDNDGLLRIREDMRPGDAVIIKSGPLKGFFGIFERYMKESERVMILLNTVSYQARVQVESNIVMKSAPCSYGD